MPTYCKLFSWEFVCFAMNGVCPPLLFTAIFGGDVMLEAEAPPVGAEQDGASDGEGD